MAGLSSMCVLEGSDSGMIRPGADVRFAGVAPLALYQHACTAMMRYSLSRQAPREASANVGVELNIELHLARRRHPRWQLDHMPLPASRGCSTAEPQQVYHYKTYAAGFHGSLCPHVERATATTGSACTSHCNHAAACSASLTSVAAFVAVRCRGRCSA